MSVMEVAHGDCCGQKKSSGAVKKKEVIFRTLHGGPLCVKKIMTYKKF
jgi:hypothetical protein